jgi:hypothetical protein
MDNMSCQAVSGISGWQQRTYPASGSSIKPYEGEPFSSSFEGSPTSSRLDFSSFINSMDDASFAYFSLIREYASRQLQGNALQYEGLYRAMVGQTAADELLSRISIVEFQSGDSRSKTFTTYNEFKLYLEDGESQSIRRLIILEDLPVRFVCLLGSRLRIHPAIFARHYSTEDSSTVSDNITTLPSIEQEYTGDGLEYESDVESKHDDARKSFTIRYPITMPHVSATQHPDPRLCPPWLKPSSRHQDQSGYPKFIVERSLDTPSKHDKWDSRGEISELEGHVTYWSQILRDGGWNALLLVDPCLKDPSHLALINGAPYPNLSRIIRYPQLEDHQKVDIAPNPLQWHPSAAFTKYILHDDILIHFSVADAGPGQNPLAITPFIRGFAISKWAAHLNHIRRCYSHTRAALFSGTPRHTADDPTGLVHHTAHWGADWKEWMFEAMTRFTTDLALYRLDAETNMRALGIDIDDSSSFGLVGKREAQMWRYIRATCIDLQDMFEQLTSSYTQVVALREAQASNLQARSVRWLTILGTFFVPLSVVAGIMSMGGEFLPGEKRFWVYFVVVGLVLLGIAVVLGVVLGWDSGVRLVRRSWGKRSE